MAEQATGAYLQLVGWRDARGRFTQIEREGVDAMNAALKSLLDEGKQLAIKESPRSARSSTQTQAKSKRAPKRGAQRGTRTAAQPHGKPFADQWRVEFEQTSKGGTGFLVNAAEYATYVMFPTKPHQIVARHAKALRWQTPDGTVHFAKSVHHPGTKGNDIVGRVLQVLKPKFEQEGRRVAVKAAAAFVDAFRGR